MSGGPTSDRIPMGSSPFGRGNRAPRAEEIEGYQAVIHFNPGIDMFRGEFVGLNGGADFCAPDVAGLRKEGTASLRVFLEMCEEDGVEPRRRYSGKLNLRMSPELHASAAAAAAEGKSLNQWITGRIGASLP